MFVFFPLGLQAGNFGIVTELEGRVVLVDAEGSAENVLIDTILNDHDTIYTDNDSKVSFLILDGSTVRLYENSQLELKETLEVNLERKFETKMDLKIGSTAVLSSPRAQKIIIGYKEFFLEMVGENFLLFAAYPKIGINLLSQTADLILKNRSFNETVRVPAGQVLQNFKGDILNFSDSLKEPEYGLILRLDREHLEFKTNETHSLSISIQLINLKTGQNYPYSFGLHFFTNDAIFKVPSSLSLNKRGYAYTEIPIPQKTKIRTNMKFLHVFVFADLAAHYSIKAGHIKIPFKMEDTSATVVE